MVSHLETCQMISMVQSVICNILFRNHFLSQPVIQAVEALARCANIFFFFVQVFFPTLLLSMSVFIYDCKDLFFPPYIETRTDRNPDTFKAIALEQLNSYPEVRSLPMRLTRKGIKKKKKTKQLSFGGAPLKHDMKLPPALIDF